MLPYRSICVAMLGAFVAVPSLGATTGEKPAGEKTLFNGTDLTGWTLRGLEQATQKVRLLYRALVETKDLGEKERLQARWAEARVELYTKERVLRPKSKWIVTGRVQLDPKMPNHFAPFESGTGSLVNGGDGRGVDLLTETTHGDCELHIEFNVPKGSNSGVYFQGQYEVQILDSFGKKDKDLKYGDCGGIYNTAAPRTNASKAPGEWQSFDVIFRAPRFDGARKKTANATFVKVVHNGKVIHENVEVKGPTTAALGGPERPRGPLMLQGDHGPVAFRNIRIKE